MKFYGHANLQQNELQRAVIPVNTAFPAGPKAGEVAFVNSILYICVSTSNNLPVWVPMTREIDMFSYSQTTSSSSWTINHNLNTTGLIVQIFNDSNEVIIPDTITILSNSQVVVTFAGTTTGRAVLLSGSIDGNTKPTYAFEFTQTSLSDTWVINHNLGYEPIVRIFIGNQEVQPESITFNSINQVTVTFDQAYVGVARLI
jgi:hypothetical protein